jgi:large subunit ribosomal protein L10Ae
MSKIPQDALKDTIKQLIAGAAEKKRKFTETIELQIVLKNYDTQKDKRFAGSIKLPNIPRPRMTCCVLGDAKHVEQAKAAGIPCMDVEALKALNKDKKKVKKLAVKYSFFLASQPIMKQIPRLLGPTMNKLGKFPTLLEAGADINEKIDGIKSTVKFQLKKVLTLGVACGHVDMKEDQVYANIMITVNFLISLLKKNWQNIKTLNVKSTMGKPFRIF